MLFQELSIFTLRLRASGKIENIRRYMKYLYIYWYHKGYWGAISSSLVDFLNMFVVFIVAFIFTVCFHWEIAMQCVDAECSNTSITGGIAVPYLFHKSILGKLAGIVFLVTSLVACGYEGVKFVQMLCIQYEIEQNVRSCGVDTGYLTIFHKWRHRWHERYLQRSSNSEECNNRECVTLHKTLKPLLTTMGWGEFVEMMCETREPVNSTGNTYSTKLKTNQLYEYEEEEEEELEEEEQHSHELQCVHGRANPSFTSSPSSSLLTVANVNSPHNNRDDPLDVLHAIQSLLHTENYLIALYENGILELHSLKHVREKTLNMLLAVMFDPFHTLLPFHQCLWALRGKVIQMCLYNISLYPFIATYTIMKMLVKHAAQFKANYRDFTRREWNTRAKWTFRLYNEVQHLHACRLVSGNDIAREMVERLEVSNSLSRFMRRLSSTVVLVSVVLSFVNPSLLIHGQIMQLSIVWWLTIALIVYATFNDEDPREREYVYVNDLERLINAIHFSEEVWSDSGEAFLESITTRYLRSRYELIMRDLWETLILPYTLVRLLTDGSLELLAQTVEEVSVFVEGVGSVAEGAAFDVNMRRMLSDHMVNTTLNTNPNRLTKARSTPHNNNKIIYSNENVHSQLRGLHANDVVNGKQTTLSTANELIDKWEERQKANTSSSSSLELFYSKQSNKNNSLSNTCTGADATLANSHGTNGRSKLLARLTAKVNEYVYGKEMLECTEVPAVNTRELRRKYSVASFAAVYSRWTQRQLRTQTMWEANALFSNNENEKDDIFDNNNNNNNNSNSSNSINNNSKDDVTNEELDRRIDTYTSSREDEIKTHFNSHSKGNNNVKINNNNNSSSDWQSGIAKEKNDYINSNDDNDDDDEKEDENNTSDDVQLNKQRCSVKQHLLIEKNRGRQREEQQQQHEYKEFHSGNIEHLPTLSSFVRDLNECVQESVSMNECETLNERHTNADTSIIDNIEGAAGCTTEHAGDSKLRSIAVKCNNVKEYKHKHQPRLISANRHHFIKNIMTQKENEVKKHHKQSGTTNLSDNETNASISNQSIFENNDNSINSKNICSNSVRNRHGEDSMWKGPERQSAIALSRRSLDPHKSTAHEREQLFVSQVRSMMHLQSQQTRSSLASYGTSNSAKTHHRKKTSENTPIKKNDDINCI